MNEFILSLIKYTAIFTCMLYAYTKLLRIKLTAWDMFDIPVFIALSVALSLVTKYAKLFVPIGFLIFGIVFLYLRFRKPVYETITVSTIALGISIVIFVLSIMFVYPVASAFYFVKNASLKIILVQIVVAVIQIASLIFLFKIKRLQSGINPKSKNATFDILLYISVVCIFAMMLLYAKEIKQYMLEVILLVITLCGLLLILWWRRHITYNYREAVKQQNFNRMEDTIEEYELNSVENDLQVAVYAKLFHYLNKALPDCAVLMKNAAAQTGCTDACAARDIMQRILREMNIANEKCSLQSIPQTGVRVIDVPIIQLFTAAENKSFNASTDISADVKGWFTENKLQKDDVHILLAYLCDNAIISALGSPNARVRVEFATTTKRQPLIRIYDSGKQFNEEVIAKLGTERITTRAGACGSGIGLFTVFEILAKYGASFTLDEATQNLGFTKFIEIAFDGRRSVTVRTRRESVADACAARSDITVECAESTEAAVLRDGTNG